MNSRISARLLAHLLVLTGIIAFLASFPAMLPGFLLSLSRLALLIKACSVNAGSCLALAGFWVVIIVAVLTLILDIRMLRKGEGLDGRLWRSLALELLLPAGWYATLAQMGHSDVVGPAWLLLPGPAIMVSLIVSAVVAWLLVKDRLKAALSAARAWMERAIALLLTLAGGALAYLFADLLIGQFSR